MSLIFDALREMETQPARAEPLAFAPARQIAPPRRRSQRRYAAVAALLALVGAAALAAWYAGASQRAVPVASAPTPARPAPEPARTAVEPVAAREVTPATAAAPLSEPPASPVVAQAEPPPARVAADPTPPPVVAASAETAAPPVAAAAAPVVASPAPAPHAAPRAAPEPASSPFVAAPASASPAAVDARVSAAPAAPVATIDPAPAAPPLATTADAAPPVRDETTRPMVEDTANRQRIVVSTAQAAAAATPVDELAVQRRVASFSEAMQRTDYPAARRELDALAAQLAPGSLTLLRLRAWHALASGDGASARNLYEQILGRVADDENAAMNLAVLDAREGRVERARERLKRLLARHPGAPQIGQVLRSLDERGP